jgi:hypothetical protein
MPPAEPRAERPNEERRDKRADGHQTRYQLLDGRVDIIPLQVWVVVAEDLKEARHRQEAADQGVVQAILEGGERGDEADDNALDVASHVEFEGVG